MDKLIKALKVIQKHCDWTRCVECPFNRPEIRDPKDYCRLCADFPVNWDTLIHELEEGEKESDVK